MKRVKVYVRAPEGRFIPGLGGRECGQYYLLPEADAAALAAGDPGLELEPKAARRAVEEKAVEEASNG